jgi:hypothetical protein
MTHADAAGAGRSMLIMRYRLPADRDVRGAATGDWREQLARQSQLDRLMAFAFAAAAIAACFIAFHYWYWKQADRSGRGASYRDTSRLTVYFLAPMAIVFLVIGVLEAFIR